MWYKPHFDIVEDHGTTHVSVVDANGGACALTTTGAYSFASLARGLRRLSVRTVNIPFGSQVMDPETGIILKCARLPLHKPYTGM